jgi:hypothetical protein
VVDDRVEKKNSEKKATIDLTGDIENDEPALRSIGIPAHAIPEATNDYLTAGGDSINNRKSLVAAANAEDGDERENPSDYWDLGKPNRFMKPRSPSPEPWGPPPPTNKYWDFSGRSEAYSKKIPCKKTPGFRTTKKY